MAKENVNSKSKRILKNTLFLYVRMLFIMFVTFFTSRVILHNLGIIDYGIQNVVGGLATMFVFFRSALANVTQRCLSIELGKNNIDGARLVFQQHQTIYIIIAIIVVICSETIGLWLLYNNLSIPEERFVAALWCFHFTVLSMAITILSVVYDSILIAHENMRIYSYVGIAEGVLKLSIAYIISISIFDRLIVYSFLLTAIALGIRIFYSIYCSRCYKEYKYRVILNKSDLKDVASLVGWNTVGTMVWALNDQGINLLLNIFFGPAVNAARGVSFQVNQTINNFGNNFYTSVRPQLVKAYSQKDFAYLYALFFSSSKLSVFLLWILCLPLMLRIDYVLGIWLHEVPQYTNVFTLWVLAYSIVNSLNNPIWTLALAIGELRKYIIYGSAVFFMVFPISYICLSLGWHPVSVFVCMFFVRIIYIAVVLHVERQYIPLSMSQYAKDVVSPIAIVATTTSIICYFFNSVFPNNLFGMIIFSLLTLCINGTFIWLFGLKDSEKEQAKKILFRKFSIIK